MNTVEKRVISLASHTYSSSYVQLFLFLVDDDDIQFKKKEWL